MAKISAFVRWNDAFSAQLNGQEYMFVPVGNSRTPFKNKAFEFARFLIFSKKADGGENLTVLELLSDENAHLSNDLSNIVVSVLTNKLSRQNAKIQNLNAAVMFFNERYLEESSYKLRNGEWSAERISFRSDMEIQLKTKNKR